jgi:hypothetical protein
MTYRNCAIALMSTLLTAAACDPPAAHDDPPDAGGAEDEQQFRTTYGSGSGANPPVFGNTCAIGDHALNEVDALGKLHDGSILRAVYPWDPITKSWAGNSFTQVWVEDDGEIRARRGVVVYQGSQLQGSRWLVEKERDGVVEAREMTIHSYQYDATERLHRYALTYPNKPSYGLHVYDQGVPLLANGQRSACVPDEDGNIEAIMLGGHHIDLETSEVSSREDTLVFACLSGALGKALRWGYRPGPDAVSPEAYQAAIHMVRADYCGDGVSWTEPGQEIDITDRWKVNDWRNPGQFTATEAIWGPDGAICLGTPRLQQEFSADDIVCPSGPIPSCDELDEQATFELSGGLWTRIWPQL